MEDRRAFVKEKGLCFICLLYGHRAAQCKAKIVWRKCGGKHNSLLHVDRKLVERPVTAD